ncbi:MAG: SMC family ATPase, partial [Clostridiales bacterium]|nr:SMC family ATPase [Clostridiales bacterium]
ERYERMRKENAAAVVRLSLSDGDACPVCGGAYRANACPDVSAGEKELAAQKSAWEKSEKAAAAYTEELQKNLQARFAAEAKKAEATAKRDGVTEEGKRIAEEVKAARERIAERLGGKSPAEARAFATENANAFARVREKWEEARTKLQQSQADLAARISAAREKAAAAQKTLAALPSAPFDAQAFAAAQAALKACKEQTSALAEKAGGIAAQIEQLEMQLQKKKALLQKRKEINAVLENVLRLFACTHKDRLLSFVAEQYMQAFTATAGETLFSLTGGKYTLIYDEDEFWVLDFLADNARRKVKTLSGGETFLASMSIAMAISRALAAQNYEFFFLDEGFGTLHERAVETVANALIELSRSTTVGIVTHRTELADRIAARLTVLPATEECGSTVAYSEA